MVFYEVDCLIHGQNDGFTFVPLKVQSTQVASAAKKFMMVVNIIFEGKVGSSENPYFLMLSG